MSAADELSPARYGLDQCTSRGREHRRHHAVPSAGQAHRTRAVGSAWDRGSHRGSQSGSRQGVHHHLSRAVKHYEKRTHSLVISLSCTAAYADLTSLTASQAGDLLKDRRRINVCLTRAKSKLVIVGSRSTVASAPVMQELLNVMHDQDWIYQVPAQALARAVEQPQERAASKPARRGGGALALRQPLATDIMNHMLP